MKKLIKISDYYYVIDDKAEIKKGDWYLLHYDYKIVKNEKEHINIEDCKVIATTDPSLLLSQITNPSDELVGKEVEVEFRHKETGLKVTQWIFANDEAIIKPISKETSTNETLEAVADIFNKENFIKFIQEADDIKKLQHYCTNKMMYISILERFEEFINNNKKNKLRNYEKSN